MSETVITTSRRFLPTARQWNWLIAIGLISIGYGMYLRYMVIENVPVGLACDTGAQTWLCLTRKVSLTLDETGVYGWVAAGAAALTVFRPSLVPFAIALAASGLGLVLHNGGPAGFAVAMLVISLARPARAPE